MGGEKFPVSPVRLGFRGSPPRGRGKAYEKIQSYRDEGITPAWAGKRHINVHKVCVSEDHPRVGGEKLQICEKQG